MEDKLTGRLMDVASDAARFCAAVENCRENSQKGFVKDMLRLLPRLYLDFSEPTLDLGENEEYFSTYVDEDHYNAVRNGVWQLLHEHDDYLETFEEDMKYSDTPVAATVSESLADIFQPLYNFISVVKDSESESLVGAYLECREGFATYWSQTLCNVLRPLNQLFYQGELSEEEDTGGGFDLGDNPDFGDYDEEAEYEEF